MANEEFPVNAQRGVRNPIHRESGRGYLDLGLCWHRHNTEMRGLSFLQTTTIRDTFSEAQLTLLTCMVESSGEFSPLGLAI